MNDTGNVERVRFLEGERVYLAPMRAEDFDAHYRWDHDRELVYLDDNYFRPKHYGRAKESFEKRIEADDTMSFVIVLKATGAVIGLMELYDVDDYERKCYWGIILEKPHWRKGIGSEVAQMMLKYVFEELGFRRLKAARGGAAAGVFLRRGVCGWSRLCDAGGGVSGEVRRVNLEWAGVGDGACPAGQPEIDPEGGGPGLLAFPTTKWWATSES